MANPFPKAPYRVDPYKAYRFRVKWDGEYVAGVSRVGPLVRTTEVDTHRAGGAPGLPGRSPGQTSYAPIVLERGVTHDVAFEQWANKVWDHGNASGGGPGGGPGGEDVSLKDFRKDIVIELYNEAGQLVIAYNVYRCWPSEYQALPELSAASSGAAIELLRLENEGWERDTSVEPQEEPSYTLPADDE